MSETTELIFSQELPPGFLDSLDSLNIPRLTPQDPSWFHEGMGAQILKDHYSYEKYQHLVLINLKSLLVFQKKSFQVLLMEHLASSMLN